MPGNTEYYPGKSGNLSDRPIGSRNKRTTEIINQLIKLGHKDPLTTLSKLQNSSPDEAIRASAANMLAPYLHSKLGATPALPPKIYLETQILLPCPSPKTIEQVNANIWYLHQLKLTKPEARWSRAALCANARRGMTTALASAAENVRRVTTMAIPPVASLFSAI